MSHHAGAQCVFRVATVKTPEWWQLKSFWCLYCWLWVYFAPFSGVYVVRFEQVNAGWVRDVFVECCFIYISLFNENVKIANEKKRVTY